MSSKNLKREDGGEAKEYESEPKSKRQRGSVLEATGPKPMTRELKSDKDVTLHSVQENGEVRLKNRINLRNRLEWIVDFLSLDKVVYETEEEKQEMRKGQDRALVFADMSFIEGEKNWGYYEIILTNFAKEQKKTLREVVMDATIECVDCYAGIMFDIPLTKDYEKWVEDQNMLEWFDTSIENKEYVLYRAVFKMFFSRKYLCPRWLERNIPGCISGMVRTVSKSNGIIEAHDITEYANNDPQGREIKRKVKDNMSGVFGIAKSGNETNDQFCYNSSLLMNDLELHGMYPRCKALTEAMRYVEDASKYVSWSNKTRDSDRKTVLLSIKHAKGISFVVDVLKHHARLYWKFNEETIVFTKQGWMTKDEFKRMFSEFSDDFGIVMQLFDCMRGTDLFILFKETPVGETWKESKEFLYYMLLERIEMLMEDYEEDSPQMIYLKKELETAQKQIDRFKKLGIANLIPAYKSIFWSRDMDQNSVNKQAYGSRHYKHVNGLEENGIDGWGSVHTMRDVYDEAVRFLLRFGVEVTYQNLHERTFYEGVSENQTSFKRERASEYATMYNNGREDYGYESCLIRELMGPIGWASHEAYQNHQPNLHWNHCYMENISKNKLPPIDIRKPALFGYRVVGEKGFNNSRKVHSPPYRGKKLYNHGQEFVAYRRDVYHCEKTCNGRCGGEHLASVISGTGVHYVDSLITKRVVTCFGVNPSGNFRVSKYDLLYEADDMENIPVGYVYLHNHMVSTRGQFVGSLMSDSDAHNDSFNDVMRVIAYLSTEKAYRFVLESEKAWYYLFDEISVTRPMSANYYGSYLSTALSMCTPNVIMNAIMRVKDLFRWKSSPGMMLCSYRQNDGVLFRAAPNNIRYGMCLTSQSCVYDKYKLIASSELGVCMQMVAQCAKKEGSIVKRKNVVDIYHVLAANNGKRVADFVTSDPDLLTSSKRTSCDNIDGIMGSEWSVLLSGPGAESYNKMQRIVYHDYMPDDNRYNNDGSLVMGKYMTEYQQDNILYTQCDFAKKIVTLGYTPYHYSAIGLCFSNLLPN